MKPRNLLPLLLALPLTVQADDTLASLESEARGLLAQGRSMNRHDPGSCGQRMRALQPQTRQLEARAKALPESPNKFWLGVAASPLYLCVSCHRQLGPENCGHAAESLGHSDAR